MIIGIPRETKCGEGRVAIDANGLKSLAKTFPFVDFWVEESAGINSGISNADYAKCGENVRVCVPAISIWDQADLIVKVKEPQTNEIYVLQKRQNPAIVFGYFHIEAANDHLRQLITTRAGHITAIAFENVVVDNKRVLLEPMSEVAGEVAVWKGFSYLPKLPYYANVMILGFGVAGRAAYEACMNICGQLWTYDKDAKKTLATDSPVEEREMRDYLRNTDLLISSIYNPFNKADHLLTEQDISKMRPGSVFVDISIDQGGSSTTSRPTTIEEPTYTKNGVIHMCVPNMPGFVPQTSTRMLSDAVVPFVSQLVEYGLTEVFSNAIVEVK